MSFSSQYFLFSLIVSLVWSVGSLAQEELFIFSGQSLGDSKQNVKPSAELVKSSVEAEEVFTFSGTSSDDLKQRECWQNGKLFWNATQKCYVAATRGPCGASEWIILIGDPATAASVECQSRPCPSGHVLLQNGRCHSINKKSASLCRAKEEVLANNPYGLGGCVCRSDPVHVPWKNRCYPLYGRGPCASGQYLRLEDNVAVCVANPCGSDGLVPFNGGCGQLESEESCPGSGVLKVDAATLELKCQLEVRQISLTPYRCGPRSPIFHSPFCRPKWGL